jgi:hypothetical protein
VTVQRDSDVLETVAEAFPPYRDGDNWDLIFVVPQLGCDIITWHERGGDYLTEVVTFEAQLADAHDYASAYTAISGVVGDAHDPELVLSYCVDRADDAGLDWRQVVPTAVSLWVDDADYTDNINRALLVNI